MNVTTIFSGVRKDTVGFYANSALSDMGHDITHVDPLKDGVRKGADLYLMIDDGIAYELQNALPAKFAFWAIDSHINMQQLIDKAKFVDIIFTAQKNSIQALKDATGKPVYWLPLACCPKTHVAKTSNKVYDLCFVGNVYPTLHEKRISYLDSFFQLSKKIYFGQKFFNDAAKIYGESRIVFNCSLKNDINMRVFEGLAGGSLLLTDRIVDNGFDEIFSNNLMAVYASVSDMETAVKYYLENEAEREETAKRGKDFVLSAHTYRHRMETILEKIKEI